MPAQPGSSLRFQAGPCGTDLFLSCATMPAGRYATNLPPDTVAAMAAWFERYQDAYNAQSWLQTADQTLDTGVHVRVHKGFVQVRNPAGQDLGRASFSPVPAPACLVLGVSFALTASFIRSTTKCRGIGTLIHDSITAITGFPTVPNGVFSVPGLISSDAQEFWAKRRRTRAVPGLSPALFEPALDRFAKMLHANTTQPTPPPASDPVWREQAYGRLVHRAPVLMDRMACQHEAVSDRARAA